MDEVVTTISTAIGLTEQLAELTEAKKLGSAKLIIADLKIQLAVLKMKYMDLIEENLSLKASSKNSMPAKNELVFRDGLYFTSGDDGPFCSKCYNSKLILNRVEELDSSYHDVARWVCNVCKTTY